jgi:imidazolonepropionase-like amidohydrolase
MGNVAGYRAAFIRAEDYRRRWDRWENGNRNGDAPTRDLQLETLAGVLRGDILIQNHCYRADEMALQMDVFREFGIRPRSFHHAVEAYKIADLLAEEDVSASIWADWWGFKMEALDATNANAALVHRAGARVVIHSDDAMGIQRLNQEAAKALAAGREAGIEISDDEALRWITANAAWTLGLQDRDRHAGPGQARRRRDLVRAPFQRVLARRAGLRRRRAPVRPQRSRAVSTRRTSSSASSPEGGTAMRRKILAALVAAPRRRSRRPRRRRASSPSRAARVHTMTGPALENATVLIRDGRIVAVGRTSACPADARRIDARGQQVTPGFIESGTQIGLVEVGAVAGTVDNQLMSPPNELRSQIRAAFNIADGSTRSPP